MTEHVWRRDRSNERPEAKRRHWNETILSKVHDS